MDNQILVKSILEGEVRDSFLQLKKLIGINSNAEVVRYAITKTLSVLKNGQEEPEKPLTGPEYIKSISKIPARS